MAVFLYIKLRVVGMNDKLIGCLLMLLISVLGWLIVAYLIKLMAWLVLRVII